MRPNDLIILGTTFSFSFLFYHESAGINFLLFTCFAIVSLIFLNRQGLAARHWLTCGGAVLAGITVLINGNSLSAWASIVSLVLLGAVFLRPATSIFAAYVQGVYQHVTAPYTVIYDLVSRMQLKRERPVNTKWLLLVAPLATLVVFFFLYRAANPVFETFTDKIEIQFPPMGLILFTLCGFLLIYGLLFPKTFNILSNWDESSPTLAPQQQPAAFFKAGTDINDENLSGTWMFGGLNALLLLVNSLDIGYLFSGSIPEGMTYSKFVHQGTWALITSIVIAVGLIMIYFRGRLNYFKKNTTIRFLAVMWILQNVLMVISTAYRNHLYINELGLTYKRIGVYMFLAAAAAGLVVTLMKLIYQRSNYFLLVKNGLLWYLLLLSAAFIPWDKIIVKDNIRRAQDYNKAIDFNYLAGLSETTLPDLFSLKKNGAAISPSSQKRMASLLLSHLQRQDQETWRSFNLVSRSTTQQLNSLIKEGVIDTLNISHTRSFEALEQLAYMSRIEHLKYLDLSRSAITEEHLQLLPGGLEEINLRKNKALRDLDPLHKFGKLQKIHISRELRLEAIELKKQMPHLIIYSYED